MIVFIAISISVIVAAPLEGKVKLDKAEKMKTIPQDKHIKTHSWCGNTYHDFGPPQKK